jgi:hypothetical protein
LLGCAARAQKHVVLALEGALHLGRCEPGAAGLTVLPERLYAFALLEIHGRQCSRDGAARKGRCATRIAVVTEARQTIGDRLRWQAGWCARLGSPLYASILEAAASDAEQGGPAWRLLEGREREPARSFLALRLAGAVHRLVLMGRLPELAALYPSAGGQADLELASRRFIEVLADHAGEVAEHLDRPVQTNEVGRCAGLIGGFLLVARETRLPLSVLEVGASAGLNLRFDRFRYSSDGWSWGDPESPVQLEHIFESAAPPLDAELVVAERRGCDASPLDPGSDEDRLTLKSYVWPDQTDRFGRLGGALEVAAGERIAVERAKAAEWAEQVLAERRSGVATVLYHSVVVQYLTAEEGTALHEAIVDAGSRATDEAPFAWLFLEPGDKEADVRLTVWPGGRERLVARAGFQSLHVDWLA